MAQALRRLVTGIEGLDALLKGGLVAGASYIIQGPPGAGKTILANQLACGHVRTGGRVLVATLLSESHERLFQYLSTLDFSTRRWSATRSSSSVPSTPLSRKGWMPWCGCCARKSPGSRPAC